MGGHYVPEWVVTMQRNQWSVWSGMSGHNAAEYALYPLSYGGNMLFYVERLPWIDFTMGSQVVYPQKTFQGDVVELRDGVRVISVFDPIHF